MLGEDLLHYLDADGYQMSMVDVRYTRKGDVKLTDEVESDRQLTGVDFVINLLPRGKDFMDCRLHQKIPETATIIDFSRPPIVQEAIPQKVVMGNRVQSNGIHFFMRLPGGWKRHELPACSMPSLLASLGGLPIRTIEDFRLAARQFQILAQHWPAQQFQCSKISGTNLRSLNALHPIATRFMLFVLRSRQTFSR